MECSCIDPAPLLGCWWGSLQNSGTLVINACQRIQYLSVHSEQQLECLQQPAGMMKMVSAVRIQLQYMRWLKAASHGTFTRVLSILSLLICLVWSGASQRRTPVKSSPLGSLQGTICAETGIFPEGFLGRGLLRLLAWPAVRSHDACCKGGYHKQRALLLLVPAGSLQKQADQSNRLKTWCAVRMSYSASIVPENMCCRKSKSLS